jgi:hypothetical protein
MSRCCLIVPFGVALILLVLSPAAWAQSFAPAGDLDCNGYSRIQRPLKPQLACADFRGDYDQRGYDNGHYVGHDEPGIDFISTAAHSGNNLQWEFTLPQERKLPATQSFENFIAFWFAMAICDPNSYPKGACIPASDQNTPHDAGSALLELQFYPPGFSPFISQISCDLTHWCAALNIDSLEVISNGYLNPNCTEPVNFAFIQKDGVPAGPPGPASATVATFTPNAQTLLMNQGDRIRITIKDTPAGLLTKVEDLTTKQTGFMVAGAANNFQNTDPDSCAPTNFDFHPEYDTAKFGNFVPWAALQANVNFAMEIGHFTPGPNGDNDSDDAPCFPGPTVAGCTGTSGAGDVDFDGTSYQPDWPDGTRANATSIAIQSVAGSGVGPLSVSDADGKYDQPFPILQFETDVSASEAGCETNGVGCVVPPAGARFYPSFALIDFRGDAKIGDGRRDCTLLFGNFSGYGVDDLGGTAQYGAPNLSWFFGQNTGGPVVNPCVPQPRK